MDALVTKLLPAAAGTTLEELQLLARETCKRFPVLLNLQNQGEISYDTHSASIVCRFANGSEVQFGPKQAVLWRKELPRWQGTCNSQQELAPRLAGLLGHGPQLTVISLGTIH